MYPQLPLPAYLSMAMMNYTSSVHASPHWKRASPDSNPELLKAIESAATERFDMFLKGLLAYQQASRAIKHAKRPKACFKKGAARLHDYAPQSKGTPILAIPSLINRAYILDLQEKNSLMRYLATQKFHPYLLDWGEAEEEKSPLSLEDYVVKRLLPALEHIYKKTGKPVALLGYCMGGLFALAAARLKPNYVNALALLATPWDFHAEETGNKALAACDPKMLKKWVMSQDYVPKEQIQMWFYMLHPWAIHRKFSRFGKWSLSSEEAQEFITVEDWLNDGVSMSSRAAWDALDNWALSNRVMEGKWHVAGKAIDPTQITQPCWLAIPKHDVVVPPASARALSKKLPHVTAHSLSAGHISMVVGRDAKKAMWQPLAKWLRTIAAE